MCQTKSCNFGPEVGELIKKPLLFYDDPIFPFLKGHIKIVPDKELRFWLKGGTTWFLIKWKTIGTSLEFIFFTFYKFRSKKILFLPFLVLLYKCVQADASQVFNRPRIGDNHTIFDY